MAEVQTFETNVVGRQKVDFETKAMETMMTGRSAVTSSKIPRKQT